MVTKGNRGLQGLKGVAVGYNGLQNAKTSNRELQRVTRGYKGLQGLQRVTGGY